MDSAIDLTSLQNDLKKFPKFKDLNKRITRFLSAASFERDLDSALSSLNYLTLIDASDGAARMTLGPPLMTHAVMLYCRAAIEDGNGRHPMGVTKGFSKEQLLKHQDIVRLRHKTMAHFGVGEGAYGSQWIKERVIVKTIESRSKVTDVYVRTNYLAQLIFDLHDLCQTALLTVKDAAKLRHAELSEVLFKTAETDSDLTDLFRSHPFDPLTFFNAPESLEIFWKELPTTNELYQPKIRIEDTFVAFGPSVTTTL